jgi:HK97 family phage prohead protease
MSSNEDYIKMVNYNAERRFINTKPIEFREVVTPMDGEEEPSKEVFIRGYAAVFNIETELYPGCSEMIAVGAADDCLQDDVRCLFNHDSNFILGRSASGTLTWGVDDTGIYYECKLDLEIDIHESVYKSIQRGDISQSSFAFIVKEQTWTDTKLDDGSYKYLRTITKFDTIYDVSPVTYPAYADTTIAARSVDNIKNEAIRVQNEKRENELFIARNLRRKINQ